VTATAPLSDADLGLAEFAIGLELTARDLYQVVVDGGATNSAWKLFANQHESYAQLLAGKTGISAQARNEAVYADLSEAFGSTPANAAYRLENIAAATHAELVAKVTDPDVIGAIASIASMESRHAAYFAERSGRGDDFDALFHNGASPIMPEAIS
jgi:hypothetical protein